MNIHVLQAANGITNEIHVHSKKLS